MVNLKSLSEKELTDFVLSCSLPPYRAKQLLHWIYEKRVSDIQDITELSRPLRAELASIAYVSNLNLLDRATSTDGTEKFLFGLEDGEEIESVLIPDGKRLTLCVSSQIGCAMGCKFCLTGRIGLIRNLEPHEIADQIIAVQRIIQPVRLTNIVFMGMGEPLHNLENVAEAITRITGLLKISRRRITVSTSGIVSGIRRLPEIAPKVNLAVSLNATTDETRNRLMPVNRRFPIPELIKACRGYPLEPRRRITFEYILLAGINDSEEDARRLVKLLRGIPSKVNLIPFNSFNGAGFTRPSTDRTLAFQKILTGSGLTAIIRKSKGADIKAACGQLRAEYKLSPLKPLSQE
jgi:23S rRNA (adenine2503-C2)-methyltransferase